MTTYVLHIADKAYSSWSLRGWLLLKAFGIPFEERLHRLYEPGMEAFRHAYAPARTLPALEFGEGRERALMWDSLAIAETLAERHPEAGHWPRGVAARAAARALAAEMHAGFAALRSAAPMNTRREGRRIDVAPAVEADLARLEELWRWTRERWGGGGPFLFGAQFTAADAFFAPVAFRVSGYALPVSTVSSAYLAALRAHPAVAHWVADAAADPRHIERYDAV
jgi:glutathione S-transferase